MGAGVAVSFLGGGGGSNKYCNRVGKTAPEVCMGENSFLVWAGENNFSLLLCHARHNCLPQISISFRMLSIVRMFPHLP